MRARLVGGPAPARNYDDAKDAYNLDKIAFATIKGQGLFYGGGFDFGAVASAFDLDEYDLAYDAD